MDDVEAWVTSSCLDHGLVVVLPGEEVHDRPWSRAVAFDVTADGVGAGDAGGAGAAGAAGAAGDAGAAGGAGEGPGRRVWFKANGVGTRHEPALLSILGSLVPDLVPEVVAIDVERAWSLTRDAGPTWRSAFPVPDQWPLWEDLLQRYAAAQLALATHRSELLATGTPERSPTTLPDQAADLIAELSLLGTDTDNGNNDNHDHHDHHDNGGLSLAESEALEALLPTYRLACGELERAGIPWTIQHDDLHSNNVCWKDDGRAPDPTGPAASRIIDWGDACLGHPFGTLLTTLGSVAHFGGCDIDDPRVQRLRDAYLEPFTTYASGSELLAQVTVARWVCAVSRALSWRSALIESSAAVHREYDFPVRGWLQEILAQKPPH